MTRYVDPFYARPLRRDSHRRRGSIPAVDLPLLLIVIGIVLAFLVNYALGIVLIVVGLVLLLIPSVRGYHPWR